MILFDGTAHYGRYVDAPDRLLGLPGRRPALGAWVMTIEELLAFGILTAARPADPARPSRPRGDRSGAAERPSDARRSSSSARKRSRSSPSATGTFGSRPSRPRESTFVRPRPGAPAAVDLDVRRRGRRAAPGRSRARRATRVVHRRAAELGIDAAVERAVEVEQLGDEVPDAARRRAAVGVRRA